MSTHTGTLLPNCIQSAITQKSPKQHLFLTISVINENEKVIPSMRMLRSKTKAHCAIQSQIEIIKYGYFTKVDMGHHLVHVAIAYEAI